MEKKKYTRLSITVKSIDLRHSILADSGGEDKSKYGLNVDGKDEGSGGNEGNPDEIDAKGWSGTWELDW